MLKKVLYISVAVIIGLVVALSSYYSVMYTHISGVVSAAIEEEDFTTVNRVFVPFVDPNHVLNTEINNTRIVISNAAHGVRKDVSGGQVDYLSLGFSVLLIGLEDIQFGNVRVSDTETKNDTALIFYSGSDVYEYNLVTETQNLLTNVEANKFIQINIMFEDVFEHFTTDITRIQFVDSSGNEVFSHNVNIGFSAPFFDKINEMLEQYDIAIELDDYKEFNEFYYVWLESFLEEGFVAGFDSSELIPMSIYVKIIAYVLVYIVAVVVLGYFLFRRKRNKLILNPDANTLK